MNQFPLKFSKQNRRRNIPLARTGRIWGRMARMAAWPYVTYARTARTGMHVYDRNFGNRSLYFKKHTFKRT